MKKRQYIFIFVLLLIIELVFKSSNIPALFLLDLLVLFLVVLLSRHASFLVVTVYLVLSMVIDVFNFQIIGTTALAIFSALLVIKILGNFVTFLNIERKGTLSLLVIYLVYVLFKYLFGQWLGGTGLFEIVPFVENILILFLFNWIYQKFFNTKYVLK